MYNKSPPNDKIIKELLRLSPSSSKDVRLLFSCIDSSSIPELYNRILRMKLSNKDALYFLNIMNRYPTNISLDSLILFKAQNYDKYVSQFLVSYFGLCLKYFYDTGEFSVYMNSQQKIALFLKFIYIFEDDVSRDIALYNHFRVFLREEYFSMFLSNKLYHKFVFTKEFLVDFDGRLGDESVRIGYEMGDYRGLIYHLRPNRWLSKWNTDSTLMETFYLNDLEIYRENKVFSRLLQVGDLYQEYEEELSKANTERSGADNNSVDINNSTSVSTVEWWDGFIADSIRFKANFKSTVDSINNGIWPPGVDLRDIYLCNSVNLTSLGEILCKSKNLPILREWCKIMHFHRVDFLRALRLFLSSFVLSGESQVIDRALRVFTEEYTLQNGLLEDEGVREAVKQKYHTDKKEISDKLKAVSISNSTVDSTPDNNGINEEQLAENIVTEYFKVAYSFVFLNTMIYKVTTDKKMPFKEYYEKTETCVFSEEELSIFYDEINKNEIKFPSGWVDGFDKYQVYQDKINNDGTNGNIPSIYCKEAVTACYKFIFSNNLSQFYDMDIKSYFYCCKEFDQLNIFGSLMTSEEVRGDIYKTLKGYSLLMEVQVLTQEEIGTFLSHLVRIERPKPQGFKAMFATRNKITVVSQYNALYGELLGIRFKSTEICEKNLHLLHEGGNKSSGKLHGDSSDLVKHLRDSLINSNILLLKNFDLLDKSSKFKFIGKHPEKFQLLSKSDKIEFFLDVSQNNGNLCNTSTTSDTVDSEYKIGEFYDELLKIVPETTGKERHQLYILYTEHMAAKRGGDNSGRDDVNNTPGDINVLPAFFDVVSYSESQSGTLSFVELFPDEFKHTMTLIKFLNIQKGIIFDSRMLRKGSGCLFLQIESNFTSEPENVSTVQNNFNFISLSYLLSKCAIINDAKLNSYTASLLDKMVQCPILYISMIFYMLNHNFTVNGLSAPINIKSITKVLINKIKGGVFECVHGNNSTLGENSYNILEDLEKLYSYGFINRPAIEQMKEILGIKEVVSL